ncbi:MAG: response regulator, partial [Verrucomicrobiota bacterium]
TNYGNYKNPNPASMFPTQDETALGDQQHHLLVVEDEEPIRQYLVQLLSRKFQVSSAPETATAEKLLNEHPEIKVIVCDHEMPGEKGLDFLGRVRHTFPKIQRILLTGKTDQGVFLKAINEGAVLKFLPKGVATSEDMLGAVQFGLEKFQELEESESAQLENMELNQQLNSVPHLSNRLRTMTTDAWKFLEASFQVMFLGAAMFLVIGSIVIMALYFLKSGIGINAFDEVSFSDVFSSWNS